MAGINQSDEKVHLNSTKRHSSYRLELDEVDGREKSTGRTKTKADVWIETHIEYIDTSGKKVACTSPNYGDVLFENQKSAKVSNLLV